MYMNIFSEPPELMGFGDVGTSPHQLLTDNLSLPGGGGGGRGQIMTTT